MALVSAVCIVVAAARYEEPGWQFLALVPVVGAVLLDAFAPISTDERLQRLVYLVQREPSALPAWFCSPRGGRRLVGRPEWSLLKRLEEAGPSTRYDLNQEGSFRSVELEMPLAALSRHVLIEQLGIDGGLVADPNSGGQIWGLTPLGDRCVAATVSLHRQ